MHIQFIKAGLKLEYSPEVNNLALRVKLRVGKRLILHVSTFVMYITKIFL